MSKCPRCKKDLTFLDYKKTRTELGEYRKNEYKSDVSNLHNLEFYCPECHHFLFNNEGKAFALLKEEGK